MEDLGIRTYLPELNETSVDALYGDALDALLRMQRGVGRAAAGLRRDTHDSGNGTVARMVLQRHLGCTPECDDWDIIEAALRLIADAADEQPRRFMHRDYHSRNLLIADRNNPAIIDFQGAMLGPITYDLASLLRDCYIAWPIERVDAWVEGHRQRLVAAGLVDVDGAHFRRWFDLIGYSATSKYSASSAVELSRWQATFADLPLVSAHFLGVSAISV